MPQRPQYPLRLHPQVIMALRDTARNTGQSVRSLIEQMCKEFLKLDPYFSPATIVTDEDIEDYNEYEQRHGNKESEDD